MSAKRDQCRFCEPGCPHFTADLDFRRCPLCKELWWPGEGCVTCDGCYKCHGPKCLGVLP